MDNKFSLRITRYQRLAMEHAKTIEELERVRDELRIERTAHRNVTAHLKLISHGLKQAKWERDEAVKQLRGKCFACAKAKQAEIGMKTLYTCEELKIGGIRNACPEWKWCGVQEGKDTNVRSTNAEPKKESVCPINGAPCSECMPGSPCAVEVEKDG